MCGNVIYAMTGGFSGVLGAHYSAGYTAQFLRQNYKTAATTGFIAYLALCFQQAGQSHGLRFAYRLLGVQGILAGIMFGYVVGKSFVPERRIFGARLREEKAPISSFQVRSEADFCRCF